MRIGGLLWKYLEKQLFEHNKKIISRSLKEIKIGIGKKNPTSNLIDKSTETIYSQNMGFWNKLLVVLTVLCFCFSLFLGSTFGFTSLFIFPVLFISAYVAYYLYQQIGKDEEEQLKKGMGYAVEEVEAENWLNNFFAPKTLIYLKMRRRLIISYSFLFVSIASFFWSYLNYGLLIAIRNFVYAGILFWLFVVYVLTAPMVADEIAKFLPFRPKQHIFNDWWQAFFFLFPITFFIYLLFPYDTIISSFPSKLTSFLMFTVVYSLSFLCLYCMVYLYEQMQADDKKRLEKDVKKILDEN